MAGPWQRDPLDALSGALDGHLLGPAGAVGLVGRVGQQQRNGAAHGVGEPDPAEHLHLVTLHLRAPAAPVAEPAPRQVLVEVGRDDGHACGHPFDDADEGFAVGLAGGEVTDHEFGVRGSEFRGRSRGTAADQKVAPYA